MKVISLRLSDELNDKLEKLAQGSRQPLATYLRQHIEDSLDAWSGKKNNQQAITVSSATNPIAIIDAQKKPELLVEYKKNLEYFAVEVSALLHAIIKDSGKFTPDEAAKLELKAQQQTNLYMKHYEKGEAKE